MNNATFKRLAAAGLTALALAGCAQLRPHHGVVSQGGCQNESLTLYFDTGSDVLTDAGRQIVALTAGRLASCKVRELRLLGLADPTGSPAANLDLSRRRADRVLDAFVHNGVPVPKYTLVARGDQGAITPSGAIEPIRRQVDVTVIVGR